MTDDQKKIISDDEEYQFPQEEYAGGEEAIDAAAPEQTEETQQFAQNESSTVKSASGKSFFEGYKSQATGRSKRILFIIGGLVVVVIVAQFFRDREPAPASVRQPAVLKPVTPQQPQVVAQPQSVSMPVPQPELPVMAANPQDTQTSAQIEGLQSQVSAMQQALTASQAGNAALQKSINALTTQVQTLSVQLKESMVREKATPKSKQAVFYLRAVVPDRAWVMTSSGETVSVSVGDSLDQYGTVLSIDPVYGVIQTSSGRKITYGANDY